MANAEILYQFFSLFELLFNNSRIIWAKIFDLITPCKFKRCSSNKSTDTDSTSDDNQHTSNQTDDWRSMEYNPSFFKSTYDKWPGPKVLIDSLSLAGFSYTQHKDYVICNGCKLCLKGWIDTDDPSKSHEQFGKQKKCPYKKKLK